MKYHLLGAILALAVQPVQAEAASPVREARPTAAGPVRVAPVERVAPVPRERGDRTDRERAADLLNHAYRRAHNAVENGASPERVRHALQEYKQHLRERLYGGD